MISKIMDASDDKWCTSTPLQHRHDSGYGRYPKYYELLELSPIRKQSSDVQQPRNRLHYLGNSDKIIPRKLNFYNNRNANNSSESDSGIASSISESISEIDNPISKKIQCATDENSNFISVLSNATGSDLCQPSKYICKVHSYAKNISGKCKKNPDASELFIRSYSISSDLFNSVKKSPKIDFLYELDIRNCTGIISDILSYLSDEDVRQVNNVCKRWQDILSRDKSANNRRILYLKNKKNAARGPDKENSTKIATPIERDHKSAFTSLDNVKNNNKQPLISETIQGRFDSFIQEHKTEGNLQALMKCPKCRYPAKIDTEFKYCCTRNMCKHEFCRKCLGPFLDNHKCSVSIMNDSFQSIIVGSKKSRKNLRRLKA